jgi:hypothetical protein
MITLKDLDFSSAQEVFDFVCNHLLTQNKQSLGPASTNDSDDEICSYRGRDNLKCAVGCLISDEEYHPFFESKAARYVISNTKSLYKKYGDHLKLLEELQIIHDRSMPANWPKHLKMLAEHQNLSFNFNHLL